ncbi:MAG: carboxymuconolactone decarboxylase family protein [Pseudomonadota bacterium]
MDNEGTGAHLVSDEEASEEVAALFREIRDTQREGFVSNFWRALANDPALLRATWQRTRSVMAEQRESGLDPLTKEIVYLAVSVANGCTYCVHCHTARAQGAGMTDQQYADLLDVLAIASQTAALANGLKVPVDEVFQNPALHEP